MQATQVYIRERKGAWEKSGVSNWEVSEISKRAWKGKCRMKLDDFLHLVYTRNANGCKFNI